MNRPHMPRWLRAMKPKSQDLVVLLSMAALVVTMGSFAVVALIGFGS